MQNRIEERFPIYDISGFQPEEIESLGTKSKYWFKPNTQDEYLFKSIESTTQTGETIQRPGEDWSEKIACEISKKLKIPCAHYELAYNSETKGVITKNFILDKDSNLVTGNQLILNYSSAEKEKIGQRQEKQNILEVYRVLNRFIKNKPLGFDSLPSIKTASDFFAGYLMLDALISNQDRHSENWGVISTTKGTLHLAPTFDHAASLGRNESAQKKLLKLRSKDEGQRVPHYVKKAKSYFYLRDKRMKTIKAFEFFGILKPHAALSWLNQLEKLTSEDLQKIMNLIPSERMDDVSKEFAFEILCCNKENIIDCKRLFEKSTEPSFRMQQIKEYE